MDAQLTFPPKHNILKGWPGDLLTLVLGGLTPFAFAPFNLYLLIFLVMPLFIWLWHHSTHTRATLRAYVFGIGYFGVGVTWVSISMVRFGGISMPLAILLTSLFVLIWSIFPAVLAYTVHRWFNNVAPRVLLLLITPSIWVLLEWVRDWLFTGFPWLSLGYSQVNGPLYGYAPVVGVFGVSWLVMLCAGLILLATGNPSTKKRLQYLAGLGFVVAFSFLLGQIEWTTAKGAPKQASLIQGNIPQNQKWMPEYRQPSIDLYTTLTREHWDSDIVLWPETALPAYFHQAKSFLLQLADEAKQHNTDLIIGMPVLEENEKHYYNSLVHIADPFEFYHKQHLVPFGEFIPLKSLLGGFFAFFNIPMADFSRGSRDQLTLPIDGGLRAGISICYEDAFGEEVIEALPEANLLINVSNDAWFGDSMAPHQHLQMAQMRSLETGRPMLRGTNNGVSAIIDHKGNVISQSPQFKQFVLTGSIQPMQGSTPYVVLGNSLVILICIACCLIPFWLGRKSAK